MMNSLSSIPPVESWPEAATSPAHSESPKPAPAPGSRLPPGFPPGFPGTGKGRTPPRRARRRRSRPSPPDCRTHPRRARPGPWWTLPRPQKGPPGRPGPWPRPLVRRRRPVHPGAARHRCQGLADSAAGAALRRGQAQFFRLQGRQDIRGQGLLPTHHSAPSPSLFAPKPGI